MLNLKSLVAAAASAALVGSIGIAYAQTSPSGPTTAQQPMPGAPATSSTAPAGTMPAPSTDSSTMAPAAPAADTSSNVITEPADLPPRADRN